MKIRRFNESIKYDESIYEYEYEDTDLTVVDVIPEDEKEDEYSFDCRNLDEKEWDEIVDAVDDSDMKSTFFDSGIVSFNPLELRKESKKIFHKYADKIKILIRTSEHDEDDEE